ncbi:MAG TPA: hypothetical protein PLZ61_07425, partial [Candidatus Cryosericum sp.]|nr:hypothetical protein [Candidatus Cryosericum sp.]
MVQNAGGILALLLAIVLVGVPRESATAPTYPKSGASIPARPTAVQLDAVTLRETWHLPALELCVFDADGIVDLASTGVRKAGGAAAVGSGD